MQTSAALLWISHNVYQVPNNFSNRRLCLFLKPRNSQHRGENDSGLRHIVWKVLEEEHDKEEHVLMGVLCCDDSNASPNKHENIWKLCKTIQYRKIQGFDDMDGHC